MARSIIIFLVVWMGKAAKANIMEVSTQMGEHLTGVDEGRFSTSRANLICDGSLHAGDASRWIGEENESRKFELQAPRHVEIDGGRTRPVCDQSLDESAPSHRGLQRSKLWLLRPVGSALEDERLYREHQ